MSLRYDLWKTVSIGKTEMNMDYDNIYHTTSIYHYWLHYLFTSNVKNVEHKTQNSQTTRSVMAINVINDLLTHI